MSDWKYHIDAIRAGTDPEWETRPYRDGNPFWHLDQLREHLAAYDDRGDFLCRRDEWEQLEREREILMQATWEAYVALGSDTDGDTKWHCTPEMAARALLDAVEQAVSESEK